MLRMNQIDEIKELQRQGLGPQEIAGRLNRSYADSARTDWDGRGPRPLEATIWCKKVIS